MTSPVLDLLCELIRCPSVTPDDAGCQALITTELQAMGFLIEPMQSGQVSNLWARRGQNGPLFIFAGHTDVVPPGPLQAWTSPPFEPTLRSGLLYGRGAADMKASIAAFVGACQEFIETHPQHSGSIGVLLTSDEEGPAIQGTAHVARLLQERQIEVDYCLVGEPSSDLVLGDTIKHGRRGSLSGVLRVLGHQGHVAYPHLARNPIHLLAPALNELCDRMWDAGNIDFPPTTFQISNFQAGTGALNVIPGTVELNFNFRFSSEQTVDRLTTEVQYILEKHQVPYQIDWTLDAEPFITPIGRLSHTLQQAIMAETGIEADLSTTGGTSDARFMAKICPQVLEFGPINASIHQVDEHVCVADLDKLKNIYRRTLEDLLC